jgi:hypothetical protein
MEEALASVFSSGALIAGVLSGMAAIFTILTGLGVIQPPQAGSSYRVLKKGLLIAAGAIALLFALVVFAAWYRGTHIPYTVTMRIRDTAAQPDRVCAEREYPGTAGRSLSPETRDQLANWIVDQLLFAGDAETCDPVGDLQPFRLRLRVPADLRREPPAIAPGEPRDVQVVYWVSGDRPQPPLAADDPALAGNLAALGRDFFLQLASPGYSPRTILVTWGKPLEEEHVFLPHDFDPIRIALGRFEGDENNLSWELEGRLAKHTEFLSIHDAADAARLAECDVERPPEATPYEQIGRPERLELHYVIDGTYHRD